MLKIKITAPKDLAKEVEEIKRRAEKNPDLMEAVGSSTEIFLKNHFENLNTKPNKKSWAKKGFWSDIREATSFHSSSDSNVIIKISHEAFAARLYGATITPKRVKALPVPLSEAAYTTGSPKSWNNSQLLKPIRKDNKLFLATGEEENLTFHYIFKKKVKTPLEPNALPENSKFWERILKEIKENF